MAKRDTAKRFNRLLEALSKDTQKAFDNAVNNIKDNVALEALIEALEAGDVEKALSVLRTNTPHYIILKDAIRDAFQQGGLYQQSTFPKRNPVTGENLSYTFSVSHNRAEAWINTIAGERIQELESDKLEVARKILTQGLQEGRNPNDVALDLVGKINKKGVRTGGVIGLDLKYTNAVLNARSELLNGNYGAFLRRKRRDKRFDKLVIRLKEQGKQLDPSQIDNMIRSYTNRLLKLRGNNIARTETMTALNTGKFESVEQLIETGKVSADIITLEWNAKLDLATRPDHKNAHRTKIKWGEKFNVGGIMMLFPNDPSAPASQRVNCRCIFYIFIDRLAGVS